MSKKISDLTSATTPLAGTELVEIVQSGTSKKVAASYISGYGGGREVLSAARNYYVRSDGSDSNDGLANTSGGAFLTIQKAVDVTCMLDMSIYAVTINVDDATRTAGVVLKAFLGSESPTIVGNTVTPSSCVISVTSGTCFSNFSGASWVIKGFKLTTTTSGFGINCSGAGSSIIFYNLDFGACAEGQIQAVYGASVLAATNYTISGGALYHFGINEYGVVSLGGSTVTITGTPAFSVAFCYGRSGHCLVQSMTFSGSATGHRINLNLCTTVFSSGAAEATYFPGDAAGTKLTGSEWF